jgi:hypothetical protein
MNILKLSNWSTGNVKIGPCCLIRLCLSTTSERILSLFIGQITNSIQAYKKSHRVEGVRLSDP